MQILSLLYLGSPSVAPSSHSVMGTPNLLLFAFLLSNIFPIR